MYFSKIRNLFFTPHGVTSHKAVLSLQLNNGKKYFGALSSLQNCVMTLLRNYSLSFIRSIIRSAVTFYRFYLNCYRLHVRKGFGWRKKMSTSGIIKNVKICLRPNSKRRLPKVGQEDLSLNIYTRCCM